MKIKISDRANFIATFRNLLSMRGLLEIDSPYLMPAGGFDPQIRSLIAVGEQFQSYLHNSPELYLKYLLTTDQEAKAHGVYFLGHVFRDDPKTDHHRKEFVMAEWYRPNFTLEDLKWDTLSIISQFVSTEKVNNFTIYKDFSFDINEEAALDSFLRKNIRMPETELDYQDLFSLLWLHFIEEKISKGLYIVDGFPARLRSMSKIDPHQNSTCRRFEICIDGVEIANAYEEDTDPSLLPKNHFLIPYLKKLDLCSGIALGVDRLLMCSKKQNTIEDVSYPLIE